MVGLPWNQRKTIDGIEWSWRRSKILINVGFIGNWKFEILSNILQIRSKSFLRFMEAIKLSFHLVPSIVFQALTNVLSICKLG